ncbi:MAG TPA: undecaprenyl-diphosphate phosphatase [Candidatus Avoscillospira stercorigallinarum]|uniref:Undecaprenyl-diphosphatase n=1 Tax=Candidatus Avoscillospira stercorigallinarum TaxID=2840708 RepID=A0A9D1CPB4_9FIRM|nr:undecaprenyl-diphosphate phosphatase [Candidatus Avoscillospira stercorigallinarum]
MTYFSAIFLGLIQGIAEFLPISSSGHLAFFQEVVAIFDTGDESIFFDVLLHLGTLAAVFVAYWAEIKALVLEFFTMIGVRKLPKGQKPDRLSRRMILFIILGTLPLFLILPVKDYVEGLYQNPIFIGCAFLGTGLILFLSDRLSRGSKTIKNASLVDVLLVGCGQALATVPGISRSGTTISVGLARGFSREFAVKLSFLLSIPAVLGANILSLIDAVQEGIDWTLMPVYLVGVAVAAVSGYLAIRLLKYISQKGSFGGFAYYCWGIGLVTLILSLVK